MNPAFSQPMLQSRAVATIPGSGTESSALASPLQLLALLTEAALSPGCTFISRDLGFDKAQHGHHFRCVLLAMVIRDPSGLVWVGPGWRARKGLVQQS